MLRPRRYKALAKPTWTPPNYVFPLVWIPLKILQSASVLAVAGCRHRGRHPCVLLLHLPAWLASHASAAASSVGWYTQVAVLPRAGGAVAGVQVCARRPEPGAAAHGVWRAPGAGQLVEWCANQAAGPYAGRAAC